MDAALLTEMNPIIRRALAEDGIVDSSDTDVTSRLFLTAQARATLRMQARQPLIAVALPLAAKIFQSLEPDAQVTFHAKEGAQVQKGDVLLEVSGNARALLAAERTALNLCQRASAVATLTHAYVEKVQGTGAIILDTRKTMPGLRALDKYAVRMGGGQNHRMGLSDMILVKDNHIAIAGGMEQALTHTVAQNHTQLPVVVECDTLGQLDVLLRFAQAHPASITRALIDNMDNATTREAVRMASGILPLEASGNMTLERVREVAETGVQYISVGQLTHSAPAVDIGLDIALS